MGLCSFLLAAAVAIALALGLGLYFGYFSKNDLQNIAGVFSDGFEKILGADPFAGERLNGTVYPWIGSTGEGGLTLEILNALDDSWQSYFQQAVSDWESGTPDALSLTTAQVTVESLCEQEDGKMKVCNGDYGDTGWRGINELILTDKNQIVSSVAKMNEYYLTSSTSALDKQYTMCHEIGHGFGLPHTDENFMNSPLGDCLDYSNSVSENQKPGQVNYDKLAEVYGVVSSSRQLRQRQITTDDQMFRTVEIPHTAKNVFREKINAFVVGGENEDWTLLHRHPYGEVHAIEIGDGFHGRVNILLV